MPLTPEQLAHNEHLETEQYDFDGCAVCYKLRIEAWANHRSHAGYPVIGGGWFVAHHTDTECVTAYRHFAKKMSES
jgi:hypothetical protein